MLELLLQTRNQGRVDTTCQKGMDAVQGRGGASLLHPGLLLSPLFCSHTEAGQISSDSPPQSGWKVLACASRISSPASGRGHKGGGTCCRRSPYFSKVCFPSFRSTIKIPRRSLVINQSSSSVPGSPIPSARTLSRAHADLAANWRRHSTRPNKKNLCSPLWRHKQK